MQSPINPSFNVEFPFKYLKHVEKLETSVFPDCYSVEKEWRIRKRWATQRNLVYVHHATSCKWSVIRVSEMAGQLKMEELKTE